MRRDLILGIIVSLAFHGGVALLFNGPTKHRAPQAAPPKIEVKFEMPKMDPEEEEVQDTTASTTPQTDLAPPMSQDAPQVEAPGSFPIPPEPPLPEGAKISSDLKSIPKGAFGTSGAHIPVFDAKDLDQQAMVKFHVEPVYPSEMQREGVNGNVLVTFVVEANGDVRDVRVLSSSNHAFEAAAIQAASKWKFRPGRKNGRAVASRFNLPFAFTLSSDDQ